jgi:hypothetical protein
MPAHTFVFLREALTESTGDALTEVTASMCATAQEAEVSEGLRAELAEFRRFCMKRSWQQQHDPITAVTTEKYVDHLR